MKGVWSAAAARLSAQGVPFIGAIPEGDSGFVINMAKLAGSLDFVVLGTQLPSLLSRGRAGGGSPRLACVPEEKHRGF